ncbi:MAG: hypothetical protein CVU50_02500 [Candidatus Cloacimonetes bacterium HGW-Cloacimonetes-3]|jgi:uncharacterized protein (DUF488 family)|nr:MAG: hypothetical protein CVU50_02500 [Candidatus Cloacimonetes bacterium HGW-Cloacimonetes-3]
MDTIYSIGHSNHEASQLLALLQQHGVDVVLDVRSTPFSQRYPQFNSDELQLFLGRHLIAYAPFGLWFGARQSEEVYYTPAGWLNYSWFTASPTFGAGIKEMDNYLVQGKKPVLLCAEKDPFDCHRAIMVGRALSLQGYFLRHILADGNLQTQEELDTRLLDKYFPKRNESSIFDLIDGETDPAELLNQAYLKRNEAIAWRLEATED